MGYCTALIKRVSTLSPGKKATMPRLCIGIRVLRIFCCHKRHVVIEKLLFVVLTIRTDQTSNHHSCTTGIESVIARLHAAMIMLIRNTPILLFPSQDNISNNFRHGTTAVFAIWLCLATPGYG